MGARGLILPFSFLLASALPVQAWAAEPPAAYRYAADKADVPAAVLYSLALQESRASLPSGVKPWPWTLNIAGEPWRFKNRKSACTALSLAVQVVNPKQVDAGLGQVNIGWQGYRFNSLCEALEPRKNLVVSAQILREHYDATGDWVKAAGRYHRPAGGAPAARYRSEFKEHAARVLQVAVADVPKALGTL
jgi:hypothetical protein